MIENDLKLEKWKNFCSQKKLSSSFANPPIDRIVRRLGFELEPVIFWPFKRTVIVLGTYFSLAWGLFMYFILWRNQAGMSVKICLIASISAGVLWAVSMALTYSYKRRKLGLTTWRDFNG